MDSQAQDDILPTREERFDTEADLNVPEGELLIGTITGITEEGSPQLRFMLDGAWRTVAAVPMISMTPKHVGRQGVAMMANGEIKALVLVGLVHSPLDTVLQQAVTLDGMSEPEAEPYADVDGQSRIIEGKEQVVLRCGDASITLTKAGKIILRGKHLVSRSSGVNRILGGSIQMN
ncbi:hypothetical protein [Marinimicrobium alkaliphilum]|uniref:hypothetical protein n=1 Tax=Marinimicrobium alkaliphilum TaxID=2202654 RepID=UPI000DBA1DF1|nr:hypothetical protein [Marinimicrobium alkaliphilum]